MARPANEKTPCVVVGCHKAGLGVTRALGEQGVPVVVNALCEPTRDHCAQSCGGMWFGSYRQFEVVLDRLLADEGLRRWLGANGRAYVQEHYQWAALVPRYTRFLTSVVERRHALR